MENKTSNKTTKPKQNYKVQTNKTENEKKENTVTVMEVLMKAEAEQTSSISSGWKRELLHHNIRKTSQKKTHFILGIVHITSPHLFSHIFTDFAIKCRPLVFISELDSPI